MLKIAFALQVTVAGAFGLGGGTTSIASKPAPSDPTLPRAPSVLSCSVCDENYQRCILPEPEGEGLTAAGCKRMTANCYKNCYNP